MKFLIVSIISILVIVFFENKLKLKRDGSLLESFKHNFNLLNIICISLSFASLMLIISLILEKLDIFTSSSGTFDLSSLPYILYTLSVVPLIEEYFYRFLPYRVVNNPQYFNIVALVSSVVFTFTHSAVGLEYVYIFGMAIILSYIYIRTKNVLYTIVSHSIYNLMVFLNYYSIFNNSIVYIIIFISSMFILFRYRLKKIFKKV